MKRYFFFLSNTIAFLFFFNFYLIKKNDAFFSKIYNFNVIHPKGKKLLGNGNKISAIYLSMINKNKKLKYFFFNRIFFFFKIKKNNLNIQKNMFFFNKKKKLYLLKFTINDKYSFNPWKHLIFLKSFTFTFIFLKNLILFFLFNRKILSIKNKKLNIFLIFPFWIKFKYFKIFLDSSSSKV